MVEATRGRTGMMVCLIDGEAEEQGEGQLVPGGAGFSMWGEGLMRAGKTVGRGGQVVGI
jgi:hypothetical protein